MVKNNDIEDILELFESARPVEESVRSLEANLPDWESDPDFQYEYLRAQVAEDILRVMEEQRLSQRELAKRAGMSRQQLNLLLNEKGNLTLRTFSRIACALDSRAALRLARRGERVEVRQYIEIPKIERYFSDKKGDTDTRTEITFDPDEVRISTDNKPGRKGEAA